MSSPARISLETWIEATKLAKRGLGYEDILVKLKLPRDAETVDWARRIVLRRPENERKAS